MFFWLFLPDDRGIQIRMSDTWIRIRNTVGRGTWCVAFIYAQLLPNSNRIRNDS
jgi:hypothetical protein